MQQIRLGNRVFEGQNNAYLVGADANGPTTLVDTGVATPETRDQLEAGLADHDVAFADVDRVLLTHWHEDHVGLAGTIQQAGGATVNVHAADAPLVERDPDALEALADLQAERFEEWGIPPEPRAELESYLAGHEDARGPAPAVDPFVDGDVFPVGEFDLEVLHLPGHAAGLSGFAVRADGAGPGEFYSGDALLPHYTPNVGGADLRVDRPLEQYLTTLARIVEADFERAWPGHRDVIEDPTGRARDIAVHHRERTDRVVGVLDERGPADPWTVSAALFGDLENIHILHGPGEAYAHLDHLRAHGVVERTGREYRLLDADPDLDDLFPAV